MAPPQKRESERKRKRKRKRKEDGAPTKKRKIDREAAENDEHDGNPNKEIRKKMGTPQILKTDTTLKLAEKWVAHMTRPAEDDPIEAEQEILKTDTTLKLAEKWVAHMTRPAEDDPIEAEQEVRQHRRKRKRKRKRKKKEDGAPTKKRKIDREAAENDEHDGNPNKEIRKKMGTPQILKTDTTLKPIRIWWDIENAGVPYDLSPSDLYKRILQKLKDEGFTGRVKMTGVVGYLDSYVPEGLDKEIKIMHAKRIKKSPGRTDDQAADLKINALIREWIRIHHQPRNAMIITGDNGFRNIFTKLSSAGHTTLLAYRSDQNQKTSERVKEAAMYKWHWRSFLSLPEESISKRIRSAQFEARKKAEFEERKKNASI